MMNVEEVKEYWMFYVLGLAMILFVVFAALLNPALFGTPEYDGRNESSGDEFDWWHNPVSPWSPFNPNSPSNPLSPYGFVLPLKPKEAS